MKFQDKLKKIVKKNNSLLCVGLDPDPFKGDSLKGGLDSLFKFNKRVIDQTYDLVCAYKPNIAFYAAHGIEGLSQLKNTIDYIKSNHKEIPIILDAKRGDVGHTNEMYVKEVFDIFVVDAVTVNPYLGFDSLKPFFEKKDKGIIVICRTSNPGASDFQSLEINGSPLYIQIANKVIEWNKRYHNLLMVIGATWPEELKKIRGVTPDMVFLIPGIGGQKGDLEKTLKYGLRKDNKGLIINASRSIIYSQNPRKEAQNLKDEINRYRSI